MSKLSFSKEHVMNSLLGKEMKIICETSDVSVIAKGVLKVDEETRSLFIEHKATGNVVASFGIQNVQRVDLVELLIIIKSLV